MIRMLFILFIILTLGCRSTPNFNVSGFHFKNDWLHIFDGKWKGIIKDEVVYIGFKFMERDTLKVRNNIRYIDKVIGDFCFHQLLNDCFFAESDSIIYLVGGLEENNSSNFFMHDPKYGNYRNGVLELGKNKNTFLWKLIPPSLPMKVAGEKNWGKTSIPDSTLFVRVIN